MHCVLRGCSYERLNSWWTGPLKSCWFCTSEARRSLSCSRFATKVFSLTLKLGLDCLSTGTKFHPTIVFMFTLARKFWPTQNYKLNLFRTKEIDLLYILETCGLSKKNQVDDKWRELVGPLDLKTSLNSFKCNIHHQQVMQPPEQWLPVIWVGF